MAQGTPVGFEWWLRLGTHAEKDYALKTRAIYDCIVLNSNLITATPQASASLIFEKLQKPYIIDPMTYAFALDPLYLKTKSKAKSTRGQLFVKKTYKTLGDRFGPPVEGSVGDNRIQPKDFTEHTKASFAKNVYQFQVDTLRETWQKDEEFHDNARVQCVGPHGVVSPYFYMPPGPNLAPWLDLNVSLAKAFESCIDGGTPWYVPVCMDEVLLDDVEACQDIANAFGQLPCSGYLIWVSDLREESAAEARLRSLKDLVHGLSANGAKRVVNAHGGFLSCALREFGMTGVSHGFGYGEHRDVAPILGGGLPPVKYYYPPLRSLLIPTKVETILPSIDVDAPTTFHEKVCDCSICRSVVSRDIRDFEKFYEFKINENGNEVATPEAYDRCRFHFLLARRKEIDWLGRATVEEIVESLQRSYEVYGNEVGMADVSYLRTWSKVLSG